MTISVADRRQDFLDTLLITVATVGDGLVLDFEFTPGKPPTKSTLLTTWDELLQRGFTTDMSSPVEAHYQLTARGWVQGTLVDPPATLDEWCGRLAGSLKACVRGRQHDGLTVLKDLVDDCGLPEGWVWNAVEGDLLARRFPGRGYHLPRFMDGIACHLQVPRTFGQETF